VKRALPLFECARGPEDTFRITKPCPASWDAMEPGPNGSRFCAVCEKHVHDLGSMSELEARALTGGGRVCVRVKRSAALPAAASLAAGFVFALSAACSGAADEGQTDTVGAPPPAAQAPAPNAAADAGPPDPTDYLLGDVEMAH
jgi:hypothetical protein